MDAVAQDTFKSEVTDDPGIVLVDFWAEWCGPCRTIEPLLADIADRHPEIRFLKCDVDENPSLAQSHDVMNIPTLLVFRRGVLQKRIVGALSKEKLLGELADWLD